MSVPSSPSTPSSSSSVLSLVPVSHQHRSHGPEWQPILHSSNQVVLYNPRSHALSVARAPHLPRRPCPYCKQPLPAGFVPSLVDEVEDEEMVDGEIKRGEWDDDDDDNEMDEENYTRVSDYFQLLAIANESSSRVGTPTPSRRGSIRGVNGKGKGKAGGSGSGKAFPVEAMAEGYFKTFFQEEYKLGMGANGSVFLCQHVLDGNPLGHFAVKKIAVGESHSYLLNILREVRLLERLHHPNIITYHHAWLESCQFSTFGPKVPTLHVLMQWAEGGSQSYTYQPPRPFTTDKSPSPSPAAEIGSPPPPETHSRSARIRAFRAYQRAPPSEKAKLKSQLSNNTQQWTAVHLLSADEVKSLFKDVSILHLDLKPGNVLLTPRAMLSDFGTSRDMINTNLARSGNTGTLEYTSPESLPSPKQASCNKSTRNQIWRRNDGPRSGEGEGEGGKLKRLEREVLEYPGFKPNVGDFLVLLESLLNRVPLARPSVDRVAGAIREGKFDPLHESPINLDASSSVLVPIRPFKTPPPVARNTSEELDSLAERTKLLGLPSPPILRQSMQDREWKERPVWARIGGSGRRRGMWMRLCKSCLMAAKILSLPALCPAPSRPRLLVSALLWGCDERKAIRVSALLALLHVGVVVFIGKAGGGVLGDSV
ncbi:hypothetical protein BDQ17DRAFT_1361457 [Cyathus striatus]|nr:hypothetical protein BDQ17DRAFT_1361457 [Cyathus striatus]